MEISQLAVGGKIPKEKKIGYFFKTKVLVGRIEKAVNQIVNIVAPVEQPPVAGNFFSVNFLFGLNQGYVRQASQDTGTIFIPKPPLNAVSIK